MNKKILISLVIFSLLILTTCSYSLAANNAMNNVKNTVMNAGNAVGNATLNAKNAIVNGATGITNGAKSLGQDAANGAQDIGNGVQDTARTATGAINNGDRDYTATRTATTDATTNLLGLSNSAWTWLILGIVGIVIVALVWYYGAQYEHKNYSNE